MAKFRTLRKWPLALIVTGIMVAAVIFGGLGRAANPPAEKVWLRVGGAQAGSGKNYKMELIAEAIRKGNPGWKVQVIAGPSDYVETGMMGAGQIDIITSRMYAIDSVKKGTVYGMPIKPFEFCWITPAESMSIVWYVLEKVPINSVRECLEKKYPIRLGVGRKGSTPEFETAMILKEFYGITWDDMKAWGSKIDFSVGSRNCEAMRDGLLDASSGCAVMPYPAVAELSRNRKLKMFTYLTDIPEAEAGARLAKIGFSQTRIPAGTYNFVLKETPTIGSEGPVAVRRDLDDKIVYNITRAIWEHRKWLGNLRSAMKNDLTEEFLRKSAKAFGDKIHPAASKYFMEQGIIK